MRGNISKTKTMILGTSTRISRMRIRDVNIIMNGTAVERVNTFNCCCPYLFNNGAQVQKNDFSYTLPILDPWTTITLRLVKKIKIYSVAMVTAKNVK